MNNSKLISLIGFIKPKIKEQNLMLYFTINITKLEINNILANYYNFTNTLNTSSFQIDYALETKTCVMKLALFLIQKIAGPLTSKKQIINNWSFEWFQVCYSFIRHKNKNRGRNPPKLDQTFELTLKKLKKLLLNFFFKKTQKLILFLKQKIKQNLYNCFTCFIKTINFKIVNTFKFFGAFFSLFDFLQKIIYFISRQKSFFYKKQHFFDNFFNRITISKAFFYKQAIHAKLQWIFHKTQKILVNSPIYNLVINKLNCKMPFFQEKGCFYFYLRKYHQNFGYIRKLLHAFLFVKNILFCYFNKLKNNQLFMCLRKKLQIYNKKAFFPTTKTKKSLVYFFYFGLAYQRFGKTRLRCAKKNKTKFWCKCNINDILVKLRKQQVTYLKSIFNKTMQSIKNVFDQQGFFIITNTFFTKIKKIVLKLASFVTFFLSKLLWKWAKKVHTQISNKCLLNKYWIFIQKLARFYFFEKGKLKS